MRYTFTRLFVTFFLLLSFAAPCLAEPRITKLSGRAEIRDAATRQWRPAATGETVAPGSAVRTQSGAQATITDDKAKLELKQNSQMQYEGLPDAPKPGDSSQGPAPLQIYSLPSGTVNVTVTPGTSFDLITPLILTSVRGTRFSATVAPDGSSRVAVSQGSVTVNDKLGRSRTLKARQSHALTAVEYVKALRSAPRHAKEPPPPPDLGRRGDGGGGDSGAGSGGGAGGGGGGDGGGDD